MTKKKYREVHRRSRRGSRTRLRESILLVCGGKETEPNYFNDLKRFYRLQSVNVEVVTSKGSDPEKIINAAIKRSKKFLLNGAPYDRVYGIFDKDDFTKFYDFINKFNSLKCGNCKFTAIVSVPCFEFWFLLHFRYTDKAYKSTEGNSGANALLRELLEVWPKYSKNLKNTFQELSDKLPLAITNAEKISKLAQSERIHNISYTNVNELVTYIMDIEQKK